MRIVFVVIAILLCYSNSNAQRRAMIFVELNAPKDTTIFKPTQPHLLFTRVGFDRKERMGIRADLADIPISHVWTDSFERMGYRIVGVSKWMNAILLESNSRRSADSIAKLPFVRNAIYVGTLDLRRTSSEIQIPDIEKQIASLDKRVTGANRIVDTGYYGNATAQNKQVGIDQLHDMGYTGKGVRIGVFDAGYNSFSLLNRNNHLFNKCVIGGSRNFVDRTKTVYINDEHGLSVLSCMATHSPGNYVGAAPEATYFLFVTEDARAESKVEEVFWLFAAELADSVGTDIINSSLGYNEFDEDGLNYTYNDMNGRTSIISKAAHIAVSKGMVVVNSAGNEGDKDWKFISTPADVANVISVGAVDNQGRLAMFSSQGPTADKRIKPDVVATGEGTFVVSNTGLIYRTNGTSFAAPIISGLIACLLQAYPQSTPAQIQSILHMSGDRYNKPDQHFGYGVPDGLLAYELLGILHYPPEQDCLVYSKVLTGKETDVVIFTHRSQQIRYKIEDAMGKVVGSGSQKIKTSGINRFTIRKAKKLQSGWHSLKLETRDMVFNVPVFYP
jgi:serine protease AprX